MGWRLDDSQAGQFSISRKGVQDQNCRSFGQCREVRDALRIAWNVGEGVLLRYAPAFFAVRNVFSAFSVAPHAGIRFAALCLQGDIMGCSYFEALARIWPKALSVIVMLWALTACGKPCRPGFDAGCSLYRSGTLTNQMSAPPRGGPGGYYCPPYCKQYAGSTNAPAVCSQYCSK